MKVQPGDEQYRYWPHTSTWSWSYDSEEHRHLYVECLHCKTKIRLDAGVCRECTQDVSADFAIMAQGYNPCLRLQARADFKNNCIGTVGIIALLALFIVFGPL